MLDALRRLREEWRCRSDLVHPHLSAPDVVPTMIRAGEWAVTFPADCRLPAAVLYLPQQADAEGWGRDVEREVLDAIARAAASDPWLAENPPQVTWNARVMGMQTPPDEPLVDTVLGAAEDVGRTGGLSGLDSWYDGATLALLGGIPSIAFGPGSAHVAHTIDEHVPVDDLVDCAQALAVTTLRHCQ